MPDTKRIADYRSAKTGRFVTADYADHHPATTVKEHNRLVPLEPSDDAMKRSK